ncbi:primosomal protein N' [Campylobacter sp. MIT 12-8780]|uniref:primosomal protein N' n=1 Tax=unclassified Campylobacter TaxID=2593542 RepID=UPI00115C6AA5|nr:MULTISPECIES: primosomal protein N' [unclassified Campylobacter]NDJ26566.1 primosomal protein N' [Campylobacter sp. MIT 19-121]TQR43135.1 primosomal protein N' [Campylobacter sp. MIT 12-8780]
MNYYELAIIGSYLDNLTYESEFECELLSEVIVPFGKQNKPHRAIILKELSKPNFMTKAIIEKTGRVLSKTQFELACFISYYYTCKLGFVLASFELLKPYETNAFSPLKSVSLSPLQSKAYDFLQAQSSSLLFADTGSGKTEIYIKLIEKYMQKGEQALLLMPEISLTPQMQKRLSVYFEDKFIMWHSKISKKKKDEALKALQNGEILLVAGARSALNLPFHKLGLIIVDEEHDNSYKASNKPYINARDLAVFLGQKHDIQVLLGSATPSLTSFYKQKHFRLKGTFYESEKEFIFDESDLGLSSLVLRELKTSLRAKKQAVIFLPSRANFRQVQCKNCGERIKCPFCSIAMSVYKNKNLLKCHYCCFVKPIDQICPHCKGVMLEASKIGTAELCEQLKQALSEFSPNIAQFDRDKITSMTKLNTILKDFNEQKIDILVGTSMLAKGHDYHSVDLSVILGLDEFLFRPNYKASEECLALAMQVAGRAGRKGKARVLIQSKQKAFFQTYIKDYDQFLQDELENRKNLYPPFKRLLRLVIEHKEQRKAKELCEFLAGEFKKLKSAELIGFGSCAIELINAKWRFYLLLRSHTHTNLIKIAQFAQQYKEVSADIDPNDFS